MLTKALVTNIYLIRLKKQVNGAKLRTQMYRPMCTQTNPMINSYISIFKYRHKM